MHFCVPASLQLNIHKTSLCMLPSSLGISLLRSPDCTLCIYRQLVAAWVAVVQDYAVLGTHGPLVQAAYTPRLFPAPSLSIISRLLPSLQTCWPAALRALAATLPQAAGKPSLPHL